MMLKRACLSFAPSEALFIERGARTQGPPVTDRLALLSYSQGLAGVGWRLNLRGPVSAQSTGWHSAALLGEVHCNWIVHLAPYRIHWTAQIGGWKDHCCIAVGCSAGLPALLSGGSCSSVWMLHTAARTWFSHWHFLFLIRGFQGYPVNTEPLQNIHS